MHFDFSKPDHSKLFSVSIDLKPLEQPVPFFIQSHVANQEALKFLEPSSPEDLVSTQFEPVLRLSKTFYTTIDVVKQIWKIAFLDFLPQNHLPDSSLTLQELFMEGCSAEQTVLDQNQQYNFIESKRLNIATAVSHIPFRHLKNLLPILNVSLELFLRYFFYHDLVSRFFSDCATAACLEWNHPKLSCKKREIRARKR